MFYDEPNVVIVEPYLGFSDGLREGDVRNATPRLF